MFQLISLGTSASKGLGLHLYNRNIITNDGLIDMNVSEDEYQFNLKNSYSAILADKLNVSLKHINTGYRHSFFYEMDSLMQSLENDINTKIVILQLSNLHRDFFIYNNQSYELDFETYEGFVKSKEELIKDKSEDFITTLENDLELFLKNEHKWRSNQITKMIFKIEQLRLFLEEKNIIFKILNYFDDWKNANDYFLKHNLLCNIDMNDGITYDTLFEFVAKEKLRIMDDIKGCTDGHPNFKAHNIIADCLYETIIKHPLYSTI